MVGRNNLPAPKDESKKRAEALNFALSQIEKQYGKGSIMRLGDGRAFGIEGISTGALSLDIALGGWGAPRGRIMEIFGPESSGKTTLCSHIVAEAQKRGGVAAFIDAENAYDPAYASKIGVKLEDLLISQPDSGEQALEIAETLVRSSAVDVIVVDSVAALVPKAELEGEMGDQHVGLQARLMSKALRKLTGVVRNSKTCLIFTNQLREKIGVMFGSPETTPGGRALKYHASVRIDLRRIGSIKEGETIIGNRVRAKVVKNKIAPPFRQTEVDIFFNRGICREGDLVDLGVNSGVITKQGTWFSHGKLRLGQGRDRARAFLQENPDAVKALTAEVNAALGVGAASTTSLSGGSGGALADEAEPAEARAE
ncbi:MAG TPA: recombinase RecA [Planctomycetota bacterium]|nr:recombinase RecA [Planctomycetota bacterium]